MKQRPSTTGTVHGEILTYHQDEDEVTIAVGSPAWFTWLEHATSFTFRNEEGKFTAHKTHAGNRRGGYYWRATRRSHGRLYSFYLGASARLTFQRLCEAAHDLIARTNDAITAQPVIPSPADTIDSNDDPLLATKLHIPRLPLQHVMRPRLLTLLEQGIQRPVTLIVAPAGSGKTTLLAEWSSATTLPVSWLSLEAAENDPARFLPYLIAVFAHLDEHLTAIKDQYQSAYSHSWERVMVNLLNDLTERLQKDAIVILDDCHLLTSEETHAILNFLVDHLPTRLHLVIGTRVDPPLPLARLRARNQVSELRTDELCFAPEETEKFVQAMGNVLSNEATNLLQQRTEGWIAGVQLLMLALRGHGDAATFLKATNNTSGSGGSNGAHRFLLDYVSEEILVQQMPGMQRFLLHTCVLDRLCGPLCDAVTEATNGQARLTAILRANLFLSELDDTQTWYRYHPLFAESLRAHLLKQEPELVPELYRRASHWYEQQHWNEEACEYAFLAGDYSRAATLVEMLLPRLIGQGKLLRLSQWFAQLPPAAIAASPLLYIASIIWKQMQRNPTGNSPQTMQILIEHLEEQIQQHASATGSSWEDLRPGLPLLQAIAAWARGDLAGTISLARKISSVSVRPDSTLSKVIARGRQMLLGAAYGASGDLAAAEQTFLETTSTGSINEPSSFDSFAFIVLAEVYEAQGQLRKLGRFYDDLFLTYDLYSDSSPLLLALAQVGYAKLLYEWNRLGEADTAAQKGIEIEKRMEISIPGISLFGALALARIALARGDTRRASDLLESKELAQWWQFTQQQANRALGALPARLALACGQLARAEQWEKTCDLHFDDPLKTHLSSRDYVSYATLARILLARGRHQRSHIPLSQALLLLDHLRCLAVDVGAQGCLIEVQTLTALTLQAQGKTKQALNTLGSVLARAEREGYVRLFADEGQPMALLLAQISPHTMASPAYIQQLQAAIVPTQSDTHASRQGVSQQPLLDPLSAREQEVLLLLAQGFSNQQIAERLVISLNTAKRHVKHILARLVVTNRTQAVIRARELGLL